MDGWMAGWVDGWTNRHHVCSATIDFQAVHSPQQHGFCVGSKLGVCYRVGYCADVKAYKPSASVVANVTIEPKLHPFAVDVVSKCFHTGREPNRIWNNCASSIPFPSGPAVVYLYVASAELVDGRNE